MSTLRFMALIFMLFRCLRLKYCLLLLLPTTNSALSSMCGTQRFKVGFHTTFLSSPNWPFKYPSNVDCFYVIEPIDAAKTEHAYLELKWLEFDMLGYQEACEDFLSVKIGNDTRTNFTFCSRNHPHPLYSLSGFMVMHFHSDQKRKGPRKGFRASVRLVDFSTSSKSIVSTYGQSGNCGGKITSNKKAHGIIKSPNWPKLEAPLSCIFKFSLEANETLQLNIMGFSTHSSKRESEEYDNYVEVRVSSKDDTSFFECDPVFSLSNSQTNKQRTVTIHKRTVFVHLHIMRVTRGSQGFIAGYIIHKTQSVKETQNQVKPKIFNAVFIGAIAGVMIGGFIVLMTSLSVTVCLKKGIL